MARIEDLQRVKRGYKLVVQTELADKPIVCPVIAASNGQSVVIVPVQFLLPTSDKLRKAWQAMGANVINPNDVSAILPPTKRERAGTMLERMIEEAEAQARQRSRKQAIAEEIEEADAEEIEEAEEAEEIEEAKPIKVRKLASR